MLAMAIPSSTQNEAATLAKATLNASQALGLDQDQLSTVIGRHRSNLSRQGVDPQSKPGELAAHLVRVYRSLYVLVGGDGQAIQHWMRTYNHDLGGVPIDMMSSINGLLTVVRYLDAMRGKV
jgi:hypothetical protein